LYLKIATATVRAAIKPLGIKAISQPTLGAKDWKIP
jgi:hypothetical protein